MFLNSRARLPASSYNLSLFHEARPRRSMDTKIRVEDVVLEEELNMLLTFWIRRLTNLDLRSLHIRHQELKNIYVEKVSHYRQEAAIAHEVIILHLRSGDDTRIARLERFKLEQTPAGFCGQIRNKKQTISGHQTGNYDRIYITDSLDTALQSAIPYLEVQHIRPEPGQITILDVAALASVIGDVAKDYSLFHHMCMWWAAIFLKTLSIETGVDPVPGPSFQAGGKIAGIPSVNSEGRLVFVLEQVNSLEQILESIPDLDGKDLTFALRADIHRFELDTGVVTPVDRILLHFLAKRNDIDAAFNKVIQEDAEQEAWRRKREELKRQNEQERERGEGDEGGERRDGGIRAIVRDLETAFWSGQWEIGI
ncbi:hypothetical protein B0H19DRAFT_61092 [Mycena capillaripes]|nr:hypothetical protein B0H19DRAFT_61092 [Mycena capillaripes]